MNAVTRLRNLICEIDSEITECLRKNELLYPARSNLDLTLTLFNKSDQALLLNKCLMIIALDIYLTKLSNTYFHPGKDFYIRLLCNLNV